MSRHEGVSCDSCSKSNFRGKRYKCLICFDYDLCATCHDCGTTTTRHTSNHPMQCIITRSDFELFYGGESLQFHQPSSYSFVCPHCGGLGFTESQLLEHVTTKHSNASIEVICPICAVLPAGDPNHVTDSLSNHLATEHQGGATRDLLDEPLSRNIRRIFHPVRNIPPPRSRRSISHFGANSTSSTSAVSSTAVSVSSNSGTVFSSARENIDPIAELLSQLSGVRRAAQQQSAATTASQLQLLQQQLQFERQQVQQARERLERLPRKQVTSANASSGPQTKSKPDVLFSEHSKFLLNQHYSLRTDSEKSKESFEAKSKREQFTKELVYSLLCPELANLSMQETNFNKLERKERDDKTISVFDMANKKLTLLASASDRESNVPDYLSKGSTAGGTAAEHTYPSAETLVISKQCTATGVVMLTPEDDNDSSSNDNQAASVS